MRPLCHLSVPSHHQRRLPLHRDSEPNCSCANRRDSSGCNLGIESSTEALSSVIHRGSPREAGGPWPRMVMDGEADRRDQRRAPQLQVGSRISEALLFDSGRARLPRPVAPIGRNVRIYMWRNRTSFSVIRKVATTDVFSNTCSGRNRFAAPDRPIRNRVVAFISFAAFASFRR